MKKFSKNEFEFMRELILRYRYDVGISFDCTYANKLDEKIEKELEKY